jgi:hypothetical protein
MMKSAAITSDEPQFTLVSASCTTGWTDWVHGELWNTPDGLLRRGLGWAATKERARERKRRGDSRAATVPTDRLTTRPYAPRAVEDLRRGSEPILWLPREQIERASLRRGLTTSSLRLRLTDGSRTTLLWLNCDPAFDALQPVLRDWAGAALTFAMGPLTPEPHPNYGKSAVAPSSGGTYARAMVPSTPRRRDARARSRRPLCVQRRARLHRVRQHRPSRARAAAGRAGAGPGARRPNTRARPHR